MNSPPPRSRPSVVSAIRHAPDPPRPRVVATPLYHTPPAASRNSPALRMYEEVPIARSMVLSPSSVPRAPHSRPLPGFLPQTHFVAANASSSIPSSPGNNEREALPSARPQMQYVAPPPELRSQVRQSPDFPFRDVEYVETLFELQECTVPYTWYRQTMATNRTMLDEFNHSIRATLLGLIARRIPVLLRDLWTEVHPGVASSLKFDFSQGKATVTSARWPMRVYVAVRSSPTTPCSLIVHALEDLVAARPTLTEPIELLERYLHRGVGSGELTLLDIDSYATVVEEVEK